MSNELRTYLNIAILLTVTGAALNIGGFWLYFNTSYSVEGWAIIAIGWVLLFFGVPLLLSGLSRLSDERRQRTSDEQYKRKKRRLRGTR